MNKLTATVLIAGSLAAVSWGSGRDGTHGTVVTARPAGGGPATIAYDPGSPADFFRGYDGVNRSIGNQFDTRKGNPLMPGTLTALSAFPIAVGGDGILTVFGPPVGSAAPILGILYPTGMANSTFNMVPLTQPVGTSFLVGMYVGSFGSGPDSVGIRNATVEGQGFHAMQINFVNSTAGTGFETLDGENAMLRASGTVVPVELLDFRIE